MVSTFSPIATPLPPPLRLKTFLVTAPRLLTFLAASRLPPFNNFLSVIPLTHPAQSTWSPHPPNYHQFFTSYAPRSSTLKKIFSPNTSTNTSTSCSIFLKIFATLVSNCFRRRYPPSYIALYNIFSDHP